MNVHIAAIEYALPQQSMTLDELAGDGRLSSDPDTLRSFGFDRAWIAGLDGDDLAARAVATLIESCQPGPGLGRPPGVCRRDPGEPRDR